MSIRMWKPRKVPGEPLVSMVIASYLVEDQRRWASLACLLYSLKAQTYSNWEAIVVHDGPLPPDQKTKNRKETLLSISANRIRFCETGSRQAKFGHPWRMWGIGRAGGAYLCMSNDDNYVAPIFFEIMLATLAEQKADLAFCNMVHSHKQWQPVKTKLERGSIDLGCWMARRELVEATPWLDLGFAGDWFYIDALRKNAKKIAKVDNYLFVHN